MIYLKNITEAQNVFIPRNLEADEENLILELIGTSTRKITIDNVVDLKTSREYYRLAITLPMVATGEYEYTLRSREQILSTGVAFIGEIAPIGKQYKNKIIQYEQK